MNQTKYGLPEKQGLYDPQMEHDNCGVGFIAHMKGIKSHAVIQKGLEILINLTHRGAVGADPETGDGAGILLQIPHAFLQKETSKAGIVLPEAGAYAVGMIFLPQEPNARLFCEGIFERIIREEGQTLLGWRDVPLHEKSSGISAQGTRPVVHQIFIAKNDQPLDVFERKLYVIRKRVEKAISDSKMPHSEVFYVCSLSTKTLIYKGQLLANQIAPFYPDLTDETMVSAIALVHQRYSTNTFPTWDRSQPFRFLAHNGEINTLRGNVNWMNAQEGVLYSEALGEDFKKVFPIIEPNSSDSANLDNAFELLITSGRSMAHAMMMLVPEAWDGNPLMDAEKKGFYEYHAGLQEPWDGPAAIAFTDGVQIGATLDRNGLRPARYVITQDDFVVLASETGVLTFDSATIVKKGRLQPGKMFLIDTKEGRIIPDEEIKEGLCKSKPYTEWVARNKVTFDQLHAPHPAPKLSEDVLLEKQHIFGYTEEELKRVLAPMAMDGKEAISSMGNDTPLAVLSDQPQLLFSYFKQLFAQVTNPPIDPIREKLVMSLVQFIGSRGNLLSDLDVTQNKQFIELRNPVLKNNDLEKLYHIHTGDFRATAIPMLFKAENGGKGLEDALQELCERAVDSIKKGFNILILNDRKADRYYAPIPSLLAVAAVHHHLIREKLRTKVDLIVEAGDARDVMHLCLLVGYGATAVNPYMAFECISSMIKNKLYIEGVDENTAHAHYCKAMGDGLLKTISKMGISTVQSYHGAQIFEAVGLDMTIIDRYFTGTPSRISGIDLEVVAQEVLIRHEKAYDTLRTPDHNKGLEEGGTLHWRRGGEHHLFNPDTIHLLQHACRTNNYTMFQAYSKCINDQSEKLTTIRGMLTFKKRNSIPLSEVEPVENILKRFATGAMSFGSISKEAHETLAIAMNRIGGKSNSGEGGEDPIRFSTDLDGTSRKSAIKQVASGRFGVTANYLVNAEELQIKMAQGAKPGEGGHLPGSKVTPAIAKVRHSTPGIDLISPPPHHDIYSIEDLAQLIFDLKNINPTARINVKLVSEVGIGTVAAGVAKGHADVILVSGHDGGTGAAPITSIKNAGIPWELGLAETQQTLLMNDLRSRVIVQVDGQLKTGRDVVIGALLGAEEFGFATAALVVSGCIMMRKCHNNTCPVGVATQDPELRKHFTGDPAHLVNFFTFIAEEARQVMAELGFRTMNEMIGRVDLLEVNHKVNHWKAKKLDLSAVLYRPELPARIHSRRTMVQDHGMDTILDRTLLLDAKEALENQTQVSKQYTIKNIHRTVGTLLSGAVAKKYGDAGLPEDTIQYHFTGAAGQSFGAFAAKGVTLILEGDGNDYVGKGLSGGKIIVYPPKNAQFVSSENIIVGNTLLYGATSGEVYIRGMAGERFAVRNSGATAVVEGVGDHGCEYMTGGAVVVLGPTGRNFGAGMSGGIAYVLDENQDFTSCINYQIVESEPVVDEDDLGLLHELIQKHCQYTGSEKARNILDHWDVYAKQFVKVISPAYREILLQRKATAQAAAANE